MHLLTAIATGYALGAFAASFALEAVGLLAIPLVVAGVAAGVWAGLQRPGEWIHHLAVVTWLGVLPAWGFWINHRLPSCTHGCEGTYRALDGNGLLVVVGSYAIALLGYAMHQHRPTPRHPGVEAVLVTMLGQGVVTCLALAVQFGVVAPMGVAFAPVGLPLAAPTVAVVVLGTAIVRRLSGLARQEQAIASTTLAASLGLWSLGTWAAGPYAGAFSQTCGWTLSRLTPPDQDCHYLCTVAAQGSPMLVRPLRMGRRGGRPIVVNRQLAVANAFEDLLHERWPRFGRFARRTYDLLARDVSRLLCRRWIANGVYVAMLPAQVGFELFLLAFDTGEPEARIDRMYR